MKPKNIESFIIKKHKGVWISKGYKIVMDPPKPLGKSYRRTESRRRK